MKGLTALAGSVAAAVLAWSVPVIADIQLVPVITSGLSSPLFVGHAGDGSNRLFIVERGGVIKVLQPGSTTPTVFLDISARVVAGGEQGLLGLAFHPLHESNGRFFVFYTRTGGEIVVAEYNLTGNRNVASATESIVLTIPHPSNTNHNGGMLAFGSDQYLYIGVGDGGGANDLDDNAQDLSVLLGKILRIDVDPPAGSGPYVAPPTNPFHGMAGRRDEIYAYGLRNPWRFSFDRLSGQQWVADVGQGAREEVDAPIVSGGNYGWRVWEGFFCTNNDPSLCGSPGYLFPAFEYAHSGGRCSITGGYVYRGGQGALPDGSYVYGDFCTGEILGWDGSAQSLLLDTALNISSFGEDEAGELYVVGLGGSVSRIASVTPSCSNSIAPTSQSFGAAGGAGSVAVTAGSGCAWTTEANASWVHVTNGGSGTGNGSVAYSVDANTVSASRSGSMTIAGQTFSVSQAGVGACTYAISPSRSTFSNAGGTGTISVAAGPGCPWSATSSDMWIAVTGGSTGSGNGTVTYSVTGYTGRQGSRNGKLTIAGQTFTVRQSK